MESEVKEKVSFLEESLNRFILTVSEITYTISKDNQRLKQEMRAFKEESRQESRELSKRLEELATGSKEEIKEYKQEWRRESEEHKKELEAYKEESRRDRKEMNKQWGELANRLGTFAEDFAAPNIPRIAKDYFQASEILDFGVRRSRRDRLNPTAIYEFDTIAVTETQVFLMECKFTAKIEYLEAVPTLISNFKKCFPEYNDKELITLFASMSIPENLIQKLTDMGIYAMMTGDSNMDLVNFEAVQNRA